MFFHYSQNNSGGEYVVDENFSGHVIVEAPNNKIANCIMGSLGAFELPFCHCCGERFHTCWGKGEENPCIYGEPLEESEYKECTVDDEHSVVIHYLDGSKKYCKWTY